MHLDTNTVAMSPCLSIRNKLVHIWVKIAAALMVTSPSHPASAGTDANVSCVLRGTKGATALLPLESSANNFERGQRDEFIVESADVGPFTQLQIGHDNK